MRATALALALGLICSACASMEQTPMQERVYAAGKTCANEAPTARITYVYPDGRYRFVSEAADSAKFQRCVRQEVGTR